MKAQVVVEQKNGEMLCAESIFRRKDSPEKMPHYGKRSEYDFKLYKRSLIRIKREVRCLADKGYKEIKKYYHFSQPPKKKPREGKLSVAERIENRKLAKERIIIENVFAHLKRFRILQGRYRNRRKRFGLRFNLIATIYNYELNLNAN